MYQLIQIPLQNFFLYFMYQPQHLSYFKIFFCILCTNRSPSPVDLHSNETSADPHHDTDTQHQSTHAPPHTRRHVPTPLSALPYFQPYNRTTAPYSQPYSRTTAPPYNRTTVPYPGPADTPLQIQHTCTTMPYYCTTPPDTPIPLPCSRTASTPAGRIDAGSTQHRRRPPTTTGDARRRRPAADVRTQTRHRPDTVTPLAVPVCRTRLQCPLAGRVVVRPKAGQRTGSMSQLHAQAQAICHTLRTAHRIPRRPAGPTLVGPGRKAPLSSTSPASPDA